MNAPFIRTILLYIYLVISTFISIFFISHAGNGNFLMYLHGSSIVIFIVHIILALTFFVSVCLLLALYGRNMSSHYCFFATALASGIPLLIIRLYFFFLLPPEDVPDYIFALYAKIYSGFYIAMMLFWFFSSLFMHSSNMPHSVLLFLCVIILSAHLSNFAPVIYNSTNTLELYVLEKSFFVFIGGVMYLIILILYFFDSITSNTKKHFAFFQFFIIMMLIISLQVLLFTLSHVWSPIVGGVLFISLIFHMRRYFIYDL